MLLFHNTDPFARRNQLDEEKASGKMDNSQMLEGCLPVNEVQILIICALPLEADAVLATFDKRYRKTTAVDKMYLLTGTFKEIKVAILPLSQPGMVRSTTATSHVVSELNPNAYLISAGICGGTGCNDEKNKPIYLGDVIISTDVVRYANRVEGEDLVHLTADKRSREHQHLDTQLHTLKIGDGLYRLRQEAEENLQAVRRRMAIGFFPRESFEGLSTNPPRTPAHQDRLYKEEHPHMHQSSEDCESCMQDKGLGCEKSKKLSCQETGCNGLPDSWLERPSPQQRRLIPVHFGIYGSEDLLMRSERNRRKLLKEEGILAVDMESRGIWHAAESRIPRDVVIIRGVSDYADSHKNDAWQSYAAMTAACTIKAFVVSFFESKS